MQSEVAGVCTNAAADKAKEAEADFLMAYIFLVFFLGGGFNPLASQISLNIFYTITCNKIIVSIKWLSKHSEPSIAWLGYKYMGIILPLSTKELR